MVYSDGDLFQMIVILLGENFKNSLSFTVTLIGTVRGTKFGDLLVLLPYGLQPTILKRANDNERIWADE